MKLSEVIRQACAPENRDPRHGICLNVDAYMDTLRLESAEECAHLCRLMDLVDDWRIDTHSPHPARFPVGGYGEYVNAARYGALWGNPKRLELLDYLIRRAEEDEQ